MAFKVKEQAAPAPAPIAATNGSSNGSAPLISNEKLKQLYATMLECRMLEERARVLFKQSKFTGNYYAAVGQEATAVGAAVDLRPEDCVGPSHRDFILNYIKGAPLSAMFSQLYAKATSPDKGRSSPAHCGYAPLNVITPASTIAAQLNIATGVALAYKMKKNDNVALALSGDGSTSLGFWHEALNFAGVHNLPIVYIVQNNLWAESVTVKLQTKVEDISTKAQAYGFPGITVEGGAGGGGGGGGVGWPATAVGGGLRGGGGGAGRELIPSDTRMKADAHVLSPRPLERRHESLTDRRWRARDVRATARGYYRT